MDILILIDFCSDFSEKSNGRYTYLANLLCSLNYDVEIVTSDFNHINKQYSVEIPDALNYKVTTLHEPKYGKNICLKRFLSHYIWGCNVKKYLLKRGKPDVIISAVPTMKAALEAGKYCSTNGLKFIIDIQDLWPEAFKMIFNIPLISDIIFFPMKKIADKIYRLADEIVAVSETYVQRCKLINTKCDMPSVVYLGTDKKKFDTYNIKESRQSNEIIVSYVGSLSSSYDLETVIDAISMIKTPIKLLVMGDGNLKGHFEKHSREKGINFEFTGRLPYPEMIRRLVNTDIAVNPIRKGSSASIINKVNDYAMAGLPVINTQESVEYRNLLDLYGAGINCECENVVDFFDALNKLVVNKELRFKMAIGSRKLGEEKFDRSVSYWKIADLMRG